jgi:hypothetical protein
MRLRFTFADQDLTATLEDNPAARDLFSMLPLDDLEIDNYADNEKIAYLPRKLTEEGSGPFENEQRATSVTTPRGAIWRCSMANIAGHVA